MKEHPFRRYKIRAIWEYSARYSICSVRDRLGLTNGSIFVWTRFLMSWRAVIVFICDGLNVEVSSDQRLATIWMSSINLGTSWGSAGLRSMQTESHVWSSRRTRYSSRMRWFIVMSFIAIPTRLHSKVDRPDHKMSNIKQNQSRRGTNVYTGALDQTQLLWRILQSEGSTQLVETG